MKNKISIITFILKCIALVLIVLIIRTLINPTIISGTSMEPTYQSNQLVVGHWFYDIDRFDVVTIKTDKKTLIKRVIGLPGETIEYKDNKLYVNGNLVEDNYGTGNTSDFIVTVSNDCYFCLGDNRENSIDSRIYGEFSEKQIRYKINWS